MKENILSDNIKIDLHIHSKASFYKDGDIVKNSDCDHTDILLSKLKDNNIALFAITDHNRFDYSLFTELRSRCSSYGLNNLPGIEFDVKLEDDMNRCHIIAIFDDSDLEKVSQIQNKINKIKTLNRPADYYSLEDFEKILRSIGIKVILIVHQKTGLDNSKGNTQSLSETSKDPYHFIKVGYIDSLEYNFPKVEGIVKNNLRDVNLDFPLITGSDCHDWEVYPYHDKNTIGKTRNFTQFKCLPTFRGLLLSITSFSTRVNRSENDNLNYVKSISLDGIEYPLANGINAIIGDNGAGKSLLLNVIAGKDVSYYKKFVKINHISRNIVGEGFQDGKIAFIEQGSIAKEVREGDLFRNSNNYGPIPTLESFSKAINNYFDELIAYIQLNIKKKAALNNLKELNLKVQVVNENFYHPIFQHDLKFIDNQEKTARKSAILDIYRRYKNEYDGNIAYYKEHGLSDRIEKNLSDLRAIVYDVCLISNSAEFEEKIKGTIDSSIRSIELDYNNRRTSEETGRKAVIDKRNKFIHAIIECVETQNEYKPFPHFPKKMPGISENPKGGYRFVKKAAYHNVDLKNDFYNYCFNNAYSNEEAIKKIETIDELTSALSKYNASELPAFKKGKVGKFIEDYSKETTSISEISGDETIGNTPGEISLVYYKFKIEETSNEFDIIAIDQPEDDINPVKINSYLLKYLGSIRENKQIVIVTHNPLLVVNLDVDNVIYVQKNRDKLTVYSGALEYQCQEYSILDLVKQNLDGGYDAVERRLKIYERDNYQF